MHYFALALLFGSAIARNRPSRRDEWQAPATCLYLTTDAGWKGLAKNFCQTPSYCVGTLPSKFQGNISSAGPEQGQVCFLYSAEDCKGDRSQPMIFPGEGDLTTIGFNDKARSFRCWALCGYVDGSLPPQSKTSTPPTSTSSTAAASGTPSTPVSIATTINGNTTDVVHITISVTAVPTPSSTTLQPLSISNTVSDGLQPKVVVMTHTYADGSHTVISTTLPTPTRT